MFLCDSQGGKLTERQLLQCPTIGLREEEVDKNQLKRQPAAVHEEPAPLDPCKTNGIYVRGEECCTAAVELEPGDTARAAEVGEQFDQVGFSLILVCISVHT